MAVSRPARRRPAWPGVDRGSRVIALAMLVIVLCCAGTVTGAGAGWFASRPGELAIPPASPGFPTADYLPQVDVDEVAAELVNHGYECPPGAFDRYTLACSGPQAPGVHNTRVLIDHDDVGIRAVVVQCFAYDREVASCRPVLTQATDAVLVGRPAEVRQRAQDWIGEHAEATAYTTLDEVELMMQWRGHPSDVAELQIWPF